jgi:hypothetical protein
MSCVAFGFAVWTGDRARVWVARRIDKKRRGAARYLIKSRRLNDFSSDDNAD